MTGNSWVRRYSDQLIWAVALVVLAVAAGAVIVHVGSLKPLAKPHLPWWSLALGFAAAELAVVHLHFRRSAHSFTLADIPMVLGLVFASAPQLLIGALAGSAAIWIGSRRLPVLKVVFNIAQLALAVCVMETIVHAYSGDAASLPPTLWLVVLAAVEAGALISVALISIAIAVSEGGLPQGMLRQMFGLDLAITVTSTGLALAAAIVINRDAKAVALMLIPAGIIYLAYRAYLAERQRREKLDFLYEATRTLAQAPDVMGGLESLLERTRDAFRVELSELVLFSSAGEAPLRLAATVGAPVVPLDGAAADALHELVQAGSPASVTIRSVESEPLKSYLEARGVTRAIVAALPGDGRIIGTMLVANRLGVERNFNGEDRKLLTALANNTSIALQFDRLEQAVWQLRALREALEREESHDALTGLANRAMFVSQLRTALGRESGSVAVLLIDVDDFKSVNAQLGHTGGDEFLIGLTGRLSASVLPADLIARLGADEFAILLRDVADPAQAALAVAERVTRTLAAPLPVAGKRAVAQVSIGIATGRAAYEDADEMLGNAEVAMYSAKQAGKGRVMVFEPRMRSAAVERHSLKSDLERALQREQLSVDFQPIVHVGDGKVVAAEALVRWRRQYGKLLTAGEFVPLALETGLIVPIGSFVLANACRQARDWLGSALVDRDIAVHVNLSASELEDPMLVTRIGDVLEQTGLPADLLVFEVTESAVLRDAPRMTSGLAALREIGVRLALDQFGSGQASLTYLRSLPLSYLKIARPFIESITTSPREIAFLRTIRELSETLGIKLIAGGVETHEQLELLRSLGFDLVQGFLIGRPSSGQAILTTAFAPEREPAGWLREMGAGPPPDV